MGHIKSKFSLYIIKKHALRGTPERFCCTELTGRRSAMQQNACNNILNLYKERELYGCSSRSLDINFIALFIAHSIVYNVFRNFVK